MISIIVPLYNEASNLEPLTDRLYRASSQWQMPYEVIFVDDGSTDNSRSILKEIHQKHPNHRYLGLSRNFGHQSALCAGLSHARGEAVVLIDADLQDPPECISLLLAKWREGYHVVYGIRQHRKENFLKARFLLDFLSPFKQNRKYFHTLRRRRFLRLRSPSGRSSQCLARTQPLHARPACVGGILTNRRNL